MNRQQRRKRKNLPIKQKSIADFTTREMEQIRTNGMVKIEKYIKRVNRLVFFLFIAVVVYFVIALAALLYIYFTT